MAMYKYLVVIAKGNYSVFERYNTLSDAKRAAKVLAKTMIARDVKSKFIQIGIYKKVEEVK